MEIVALKQQQIFFWPDEEKKGVAAKKNFSGELIKYWGGGVVGGRGNKTKNLRGGG